MATLTGKHIVQMVWDDVKPSDILTSGSFHNAVTTVLALGGSTNAVVHLIAMARRAGVDLTLDRFDALARRTPLLANIRPSGKYLMEDFYYAGGLRTMLARLGDLLHRDARTVNGRTLGENVEGFKIFNDDVIRPLDKNEQEARQAVAATRYPPEGVRGFASVSRASRFGRVKDYYPRAAEETCVLVQGGQPDHHGRRLARGLRPGEADRCRRDYRRPANRSTC